ncbi:MAG: 4-deoxy-4-formamido-L-arabinose-phosphoundecaprenol deformylase [Desulfobacterales bacterium]|jgi:undecaprenyl phosphate-alpha-L-ara4FN deformylase
MKVGLRIDVDTFRGTKIGVPNFCEILADHHVSASFFFSVGPDNMGRHLWRLLRPAFFIKMLRTKASSLYGWDILLKGTFFTGPFIGERLSDIIRAVSNKGHEIGLHAWDHYHWQTHIDTMDASTLRRVLLKGFDELTRITGKPPACSAAPAWKCSKQVLLEKERLPFLYNSDCRGRSIFYPRVDGKLLSQPQIPVTLPTYDEVIGRQGISEPNYNEYILSLVKPESLNVLTVHAEVEGISCAEMFDRFLKKARSKGMTLVPLGALLRENTLVEEASVERGVIHGRDGWLSIQV